MKGHIIKEVFLSTKGDPSVGLGSENAVLTAQGDYLLDLCVVDEEERPDLVEGFRAKLADTFALIWGEPVIVRFDYEEAALA